MAKALSRDRDEDLARAELLKTQRAIAKEAEPKGALAPSPMLQEAEAVRRARLAAMNRSGRASTVLSQGTAITPAYSNTVLGA